MRKKILFALALLCAALVLAAAPAKADLISDIFGGSQNPTIRKSRMVRLHPPGHFIHRRLDGPARRVGGFTALASYYGGGEYLNSRTASGERFRAGGMTCAHRTLPLGTRLLVSYRGRSVVVRINDRGPAAWTGRSLDLARGAAARLGMPGVAPVRVAVLQ